MFLGIMMHRAAQVHKVNPFLRLFSPSHSFFLWASGCVSPSADNCNTNNRYYVPAKAWVRFLNAWFTQELLTNCFCTANTLTNLAACPERKITRGDLIPCTLNWNSLIFFLTLWLSVMNVVCTVDFFSVFPLIFVICEQLEKANRSIALSARSVFLKWKNSTSHSPVTHHTELLFLRVVGSRFWKCRNLW